MGGAIGYKGILRAVFQYSTLVTMKAIFIRPKDIKDVVVFRDNKHYILRIHVSEWSMDLERALCEDKEQRDNLVGLYKTLTDSIRGNADFVEIFNPNEEEL